MRVYPVISSIFLLVCPVLFLSDCFADSKCINRTMDIMEIQSVCRNNAVFRTVKAKDRSNCKIPYAITNNGHVLYPYPDFHDGGYG